MKENWVLPQIRPAAKKKSSYVANWLIKAIKAGKWKKGDRLPPERSLAEQLNVSRTAVREALSSLQMIGLVEPRVGDGNYLRDSLGSEIDIDQILDALSESEALVEVWEVRKRLEIILAKLAVTKATGSHITSLESSMQRIEESVGRQDVEEYLAANNDFHLAIAEAAGNPFLKRSLLPLLEITRQQLTRAITKKYILQHAPTMISEHREVFAALKAKNSAQIKKLIAYHFLASEDLFLHPPRSVIP